MLMINPFIWLGSLYQQHGSLALYFTIYWIMVITLFVISADWAMEKVELTKTQGRKIFHVLMLVMFVPSLLMSAIVPFVNLCLGGALCIFFMIEFLRLYVLQGDELKINHYFEQFLGGHESNVGHVIVLSHISLLVGCACPVWFATLIGNEACGLTELLLSFTGLITVGVGDSAAAIIGSIIGRRRWGGSSKTKEGSIAAFTTIVCAMWWLCSFTGTSFSGTSIILLGAKIILVTLAEVFVDSNDNISLPVYLIMLTLCRFS
jgi:dolichol kinase